MQQLFNLLARLEVMLEQTEAALQEAQAQLKAVETERDELKKLLETKGGES